MTRYSRSPLVALGLLMSILLGLVFALFLRGASTQSMSPRECHVARTNAESGAELTRVMKVCGR